MTRFRKRLQEHGRSTSNPWRKESLKEMLCHMAKQDVGTDVQNPDFISAKHLLFPALL
jgi:hypothetical protein